MLDQPKINNIRKQFDDLETELDFIIGLTTDERITLPKVNDVNRTFVMDSLSALQNNPGFVPAYLNVTEISKDIDLYNQLEEFTQRAAQISEKLADTQMLAGSEAYVSSLAAYRLFEAAAKAGMPGADAVYDTLKQRFAGQGNSGNQP